MINRLGSNSLLAKIDIKSAFCTLPVRVEDRELLGICWRQKYYVDCCLPFGLRSALFIFNQYAEALEWILCHNYLIPNIIHYLDDFLIVGKPSYAECKIALQKNVAHMQTVGLSNCRKKDWRSINRDNIPRHSPWYSNDGTTPSPWQIRGTDIIVTSMEYHQEENNKERTFVSNWQAILCSQSHPSWSYLLEETDWSQHLGQKAPSSYNSNSRCQGRHQVVARLPSRMEWSQSDAPSRLANRSRPEPIHRCIWYTGIRSLFQRSMDHGHMVKRAALKINPMERTFCNCRSSSHLGQQMAEAEDSSLLWQSGDCSRVASKKSEKLGTSSAVPHTFLPGC